jgi:hypothetical protein
MWEKIPFMIASKKKKNPEKILNKGSERPLQ